MAKYRQISPKIWNDAKFRSLSDNGKLVFFMLLTHPHTSAIGTLRAYPQGLAAELGWSEKAFREAFREALEKGMIKTDERAGLIWLPNFIKHNPPMSPNVIKSWSGSLDDCPECSLKNQVFQGIKYLSETLSEAFSKAFQEAFSDPLLNQEQEQEQEQEQDLNTFCAEPEKSGSTQELPTLPCFIKIPLNDGTQFEVTEGEVEFWQDLYPAVDVRQQLRNMKGWADANPKKRKTRTGIKRHINSWLADKQNKAPDSRKSQDDDRYHGVALN